jgi:hypothetical protein
MATEAVCSFPTLISTVTTTSLNPLKHGRDILQPITDVSASKHVSRLGPPVRVNEGEETRFRVSLCDRLRGGSDGIWKRLVLSGIVAST